MHIGAYVLRNLFVAPMAGVTDRPFRQLARRLGAGLAVCEMVSARPELRETRKIAPRANHDGEADPISVQIAGADPAMMAEAARYNVARARRSSTSTWAARRRRCATSAGSALMRGRAAGRAHRRGGGRGGRACR